MSERVFVVFTDPQSAPRLMESLRIKGFSMTDLAVVEPDSPSVRVALTIKMSGSLTSEFYKTVALQHG